MSIFDNREKELIEQETEEALQRASDEYQKELDEAESQNQYTTFIMGEDGKFRKYEPYCEVGFETKEEYEEVLKRYNEYSILKKALEIACDMLYTADSTYHTKPRKLGVNTLNDLLVKRAKEELNNKKLNEEGEK